MRASLVAQLVKNLPAMWETWFQSSRSIQLTFFKVQNSMTFNIKPWFVQPSLLSNFRTVLSSLKRNSIPRISHSSLPYSQSLLSFWKILLLGIEFWVTVSFFLSSQTPDISLHCLLTHIVSDKKFIVILVFAPLYVMYIFSYFSSDVTYLGVCRLCVWCVYLVCEVCVHVCVHLVWGICTCKCMFCMCVHVCVCAHASLCCVYVCGMMNVHMHMCVVCMCVCAFVWSVWDLSFLGTVCTSLICG